MKNIIKYKNHILGISVLVVLVIVFSVVFSKTNAFLSDSDKTFTSIVLEPLEISVPLMDSVAKSKTQFNAFLQWLNNEGKTLSGSFSVKIPVVKAISPIAGGSPRIAEVFPNQPDYPGNVAKYGISPWIELRNFGTSYVSINGWKLKSVNNGWTVTINKIEPLATYPSVDYSEYYVLCQDKATFDAIYSNLVASPNILDCDVQVPGPITYGDKYLLMNSLGVVKQQVSITLPLPGDAPRSIEIDQSGLNHALSPVPYGRPGYRLRLGDVNEDSNLTGGTSVTGEDMVLAKNQLFQNPQDPVTPPPLFSYQIPTIRGWQNAIAVSENRSVLSASDLVGISACLMLQNNCSMVDFSLQN